MTCKQCLYTYYNHIYTNGDKFIQMVFLNQNPMKVNLRVKYISAGGFGDKFHVLTLEVGDPWAEVKCTLCRLQESPWPHFGELSEAFYCRPFIHKRNQSFNPGFWVGIKKETRFIKKNKEKLQTNCLSRSHAKSNLFLPHIHPKYINKYIPTEN